MTRKRCWRSKVLGALLVALLHDSAAMAAAADCADDTQAGLTACASDAYRKADATLNALYRTITERLENEPEKLGMLRIAQKSWIVFRDADCAFRASAADGGGAQPMAKLMCLERMTTSRIEAFEGLLACPEGDLACPVPSE